MDDSGSVEMPCDDIGVWKLRQNRVEAAKSKGALAEKRQRLCFRQPAPNLRIGDAEGKDTPFTNSALDPSIPYTKFSARAETLCRHHVARKLIGSVHLIVRLSTKV